MPTHNDIGIWFLLMGLFVPRITLFFWWITGNLPYHTSPFIVNMFASVFIPRVLIVVWIYTAQGFSPWFWIHLITMLLVWTASILRQYSSNK